MSEVSMLGRPSREVADIMAALDALLRAQVAWERAKRAHERMLIASGWEYPKPEPTGVRALREAKEAAATVVMGERTRIEVLAGQYARSHVDAMPGPL